MSHGTATQPNEAVRRVLLRDDLLTMAADADRAIGVAYDREAWLERRANDTGTVFDLALRSQLGLAGTEKSWAVRAQAWDYAGLIVGFCRIVGAGLNAVAAPPGSAATAGQEPYTADRLHELAQRELDEEPARPGLRRLDKDMLTAAYNRYHEARYLRVFERYDDALRLMDKPPTELFGSGAEPLLGNYLYELGAAHIQQGRSTAVDSLVQERHDYWTKSRASGFSTRYRYDFIRALARWNADPGDERVLGWLESAVEHLRSDRQDPIAVLDGLAEGRRPVQQLSVLLATAEYLADGTLTEQTTARAVRHAERALEIADQIRTRWRVVARSRAPLTVVFQRIYGDLALLARRLSAAELGFRVALAAKQTGFAARIRDGRGFADAPNVQRLVQEIVQLESDPEESLANNEAKRRARLDELRLELAATVSPMLADTVFPVPKKASDLVSVLGRRFGLDYVELHDTLDDRPHLFRTLIEPGGEIQFDLVELPADVKARFGHRAGADAAPGRLAQADSPAEPASRTARDLASADRTHRMLRNADWRAMARLLLPQTLTDRMLARADRPGDHISLVISAHSWLGLVPWAALKIDDDGTRLVERAVITQSPVFTCLSRKTPPPVSGKALIRLVDLTESGVDITRERQAWDLNQVDARGLSECRLVSTAEPSRHPGRFDAALSQREAWQFVHIAAHGGGKGLGQYLQIPRERLSAVRALTLRWPQSVLMASCHVGLVVNENGAEPLNFVMAMLTGGARCVVAGIGSIDDDGTGKVASHMVRAIRAGGVSLDVALREAQCAHLHEPEAGWALLSAYVQ